MAVKIADIFANLSVKTSDYDSGLASARARATAFGGVLQGIFQGIGQRLFDGIVSGLRTVIGVMGNAVTASSDLNEAINKTSVVFGSATNDVLAWAENSARGLGMSRRLALDAVSGFGALFVQMGETRAGAAAMSEELVQLAADLSSIYNIPMASALEKIASGLAGEILPLRSVNIFLNDNAVRLKAVQMGLAETTASATDQAKVMARNALILQQGAIANGDFARTSRGLANAQRILTAELEDGAAKLGNAFRPAIEQITGMLIDIAPQMFGYAQNIMDQFANGLAAGIRAIIPVITVVRQLFAYWFAPGSPPRVLPDIAKWGAAAMGQFLSGFSSVDVKNAFATVGSAIENILRSNVAAGKADEGGLVNAVFGTRNAIQAAVAEFSRAGSVSAATINNITRAAGSSGPAISALVTAYFDLQRATVATTRAQDELNRITETYDRILNPLRGQLDAVRDQQRRLADQQRLIAAQNVLHSFESTAAEKRAAQLEIEQISLEDQIATVEQRQQAETEAAQEALDNAQAQEAAAQEQVDIAQATIDQQVEINNLLAEQKRFVEQLAAAQEAAAQKAASEAEAAANKATQIAEKAAREAEQLAAAQLRYRLEVADTAGDIAIMEGELAKLTPGSLEYINVQTQLVALHKQYNAELEAAAKAAKALGDVDISAGLDTGIIQPLSEVMKVGEGGKSLADALKEAFAPIGPASGEVKLLAERFNTLFGAIEKMGIALGLITETEPTVFFAGFGQGVEQTIGPVERVRTGLDEFLETFGRVVEIVTALINGEWATAWGLFKDHAITAYGEVDTETETKLTRWEAMFDFFQHITRLTWTQYWADWAEIWRLGTVAVTDALTKWLDDTFKGFTDWITKTNEAFSNFFTSFGEAWSSAGRTATTGFFDGLKSGWVAIDNWFRDKLTSMRNLLPFSEPKDPSSPLRNLGKAGESIIGQIQGGMENASSNLNTGINALRPAALAMAATTTTSNNVGGITINQTFSGAADAPAVRQAANSGLLDALRAAGVTA